MTGKPLESYLLDMAAWVESMEGFYDNTDLYFPIEID
jgi:hypothetical protein